MNNLDQLIEKFKEVKDELLKSDVLHGTVEGFMGGLKALPKGSVERGKFITAHMGHAPFVGALNAHPQGKQLHGMLMNHLNSKANAGPTAAGAKVVAKSIEDDLEDLLEKAMNPLSGSSIAGQMRGGGETRLTHPSDMGRANTYQAAMSGAFQPKTPVAAPAPAAPAKKLTGMDRIKALSQQPLARSEDVFKQQTADKKHVNAKFSKTINSSYSPEANMAKKEKVSMNKGGQWNLSKDEVTAVKPPKFDSQGRAEASAPKNEWSPGQEVHGKLLNLPRGDPNQVHHDLATPASTGSTNYSVTTSLPKLKPAAQKYHTVSGEAPKTKADRPILKSEDGRDDKPECSKCHAKQCQCDKTGVLIDKSDNKGC